MKRLLRFYRENKKLVLLTFEIFWVIVFVLEMLANKSGSNIPQFVYVNF